jgi:integrase
LTADEARALLAATAGDRLMPLWRLALITGFRQGELLGLAWDDVDLEAGFVTMSSQLARRDGAWVRVAPKTGRRLQRIALDPATVEVLRAHQLRQAAERTAEWQFWGLVFVTPAGMPWGRSEILRAFHAALAAAGIRRRRFHDLRHSSSTILEDLGVEEAIRMARLGHVTKAMARRYAHGSEAQDRVASELIARAIG